MQSKMENKLIEAVREYKVAVGIYKLILRRRTKWTRTAREQYCQTRVLGSKVIELAEEMATTDDGREINEILRDIQSNSLPRPGKIGSSSKYYGREL